MNPSDSVTCGARLHRPVSQSPIATTRKNEQECRLAAHRESRYRSAGRENIWRRESRAVVAAGLALLFWPATTMAAPALEVPLKADYLFRLIPFVDWPQDAFASPADPFRLCIVGVDSFGELVEKAGQGQTAGKRSITILRFNAASPDDHCQLMYVAGDPQFVEQSITAVSGLPVLTVTKAQDEPKGIVNFVVAENHIRLEIDQDAALKNHLNVSSKLLGIASPDVTAP
jgi:hypothetical protein